MSDPIRWRCFYCGEAFTFAQRREAQEHFGSSELDTPVCLMRVPGESGLVSALRKAQDELERRHAEDSDLIRAICAMEADHAAALRRAEEEGYAKGLRDARKDARAAALSAEKKGDAP